MNWYSTLIEVPDGGTLYVPVPFIRLCISAELYL